MTKSVNKEIDNSDTLFDNRNITVKRSGEIILKEAVFGEPRQIGKLDEINLQEESFKEIEPQLVSLEQLFADFVTSENPDSDNYLKDIENRLSEIEKKAEFEISIQDLVSELMKIKQSTGEEEGDDSAGKNEAGRPAAESNNEGSEDEENAEKFYAGLAEKAEKLRDMTDWPYVSIEFDNIMHELENGPEADDFDNSPFLKRIEKAKAEFEDRKKRHFEEQKKIREENLEKKKELLDKFREIVDNQKWNAEKEVRKITHQWEHLKPVPKNEAEKLETSFQKLASIFKEHKVDRLVQKKQQEQDNLTGKLLVLEKMEKYLASLSDKSNWKEAEKEFENLSRQWRKIGRVPVEKNQELWDQYHRVQDEFHSMRFKYDAKYRKQIEKYLGKKKDLIAEAEALLDYDDLAEAARKVNKLHRKWKKTGNLPQKEENELWDQFKSATDAFNEKKSENVDVLREQENENFEKKLELIEEAEARKDSDDFEKTHQFYQDLMKKWKNIGPVPKRKSGKIWKKFKGAMDHFYDRRREHFKEVKEKRKDNLEEKKEILEKLKELKKHEDPIQAVEEAKPLQEEFKKAGYVPIKFKNKMWKEYRETCDVIYDRFRAVKSAANIVGREHVDEFSTDDLAEIQKLQKKAESLKHEISSLSKELIQMKESLSYFKPQKGSTLLDDVKAKIEKTEQKVNDKEAELDDIEVKIDKMRKS